MLHRRSAVVGALVAGVLAGALAAAPGAGAAGGATGTHTRQAATVTIDVIDGSFVPNAVNARDGDTLRFCNKGLTNFSPFSLSKGNQFGKRAPGSALGNLLLRPGKCVSVVVNNATAAPALVRVFDDIHVRVKAYVVTVPKGWKGAIPALATLLPKESEPVKAGPLGVGSTATKLTLKLGSVTAVTDLVARTTGSVETTAVNTASLDGSATLNGTLPAGWTLVVWYPTPEYIVLNSAKGGTFTGIVAAPPGLVARNGIGAYLCSTKVPPVCDPAAQANVFITWTAPK